MNPKGHGGAAVVGSFNPHEDVSLRPGITLVILTSYENSNLPSRPAFCRSGAGCEAPAHIPEQVVRNRYRTVPQAASLS